MRKFQIIKNISKATIVASISIYSIHAKSDLLQTEAAPIAPARSLKIKKSLVPTYELSQVKRTNLKNVSIIPRLQVGQEAQIKAQDEALKPFAPLSAPKKVNVKPVEKTTSIKPEVLAIKKVEPPRLKSQSSQSKVPKLETLKNFTQFYEPKFIEGELAQKPVQEYKENDFKMLQALIYAEIKKNDPIAMGLLIDLLEDKKYKWPATYHYGLVAHRLGLNSEFRSSEFKVLKESNDNTLRSKAARSLVENVKSLEIADIKDVEKFASELEIETTNSPAYNLSRAKYFAEKADLSMVEDSLLYIREQDEEFSESQVLKGLLLYRKGQLNEAITQLDTFLSNPKVSSKDEKRSLAAITLGRMHFQKGQYKDAWDSFLKVDKNHPLWLDAMIEQALAQIMVKDYEGASGNMFSLHTDYFKNAFAPETYILRSVGYLNLCQYGDGLQVLNSFKNKYMPLKETLEKAKIAKSKDLNLYEAVKLWTKHPDLKFIEGIPRPFLIEIARHPAFLNVQKRINNLEDDNSRFDKFTIDLIRLEKETFKQASELRLQIIKAKSEKDQNKIVELESALNDAQIENAIIKRAKDQVKKVRSLAITRIDKEKIELKKDAHISLALRFDRLFEQLSYNLDQNDILMYEIYAGAGEHIRYQMAGGEISKEKRQELKVEDGKSQKWKFKGEIWEDEIGHFRSSLKNVCAEEDSKQANK